MWVPIFYKWRWLGMRRYQEYCPANGHKGKMHHWGPSTPALSVTTAIWQHSFQWQLCPHCLGRNVWYAYCVSYYAMYILSIAVTHNKDEYRQASTISCTEFQNLNASCSCPCPIHWSQVLSLEWRCSQSTTGRRCSNYIWVINSFITC